MKAIANKTLRFGMVSLPVGLCQAVEKGSDFSFDQADQEGRTLRRVYLDPDGNEVANGDIQKGIRNGDEFHPVSAEAIEKINEATALPDMEIVEVFPVSDIPMDRINEKYYVQSHPKNGNLSSFRLLVDALNAENLALLVKTTIRSRQKLIALRALDGALVGHGLVFADACRQADDAVSAEAEYKPQEFEMAKTLLTTMVGDGSALDSEVDDLIPLKRDLANQAAAGKAIEVPESAASPKADTSLTDALAASIEAAKDKAAA